MKKQMIAAVVASICFSGSSFAGGGRDTDPQGLLYLRIPLGAPSKHEGQPVFGFMIRQPNEPYLLLVNPLRQLPIVDLKFTATDLRSFSVLGMDTSRFKASGDAASASGAPIDINWWIVGGVALGAAVLIHDFNKSDSPKTGGFLCPPGTPC